MGSCLPDQRGNRLTLRVCVTVPPVRTLHGRDIVVSPLKGYRLWGCTIQNGNPFLVACFFCLLRGYVILLICVLIVPAELYVFRTRKRAACTQKYPQYKARKVRFTGLHRTVPGDNNRCYPAYLSCLFSFLAFWRSPPVSDGRHTGQPSCIRIPIGPHIIRI
jgi:hypothetical protein